MATKQKTDLTLTLKNIKQHPDMSDETNCFSASTYVNGKRAGTVRNSGQGDPNLYYWKSPEVGHQVEAWAKEQDTRFEFEKLDQIVDKILDKWEETRWLKRTCKKKILFSLKGDEKGKWRILTGTWSQKAIDYINNKYGDKVERIANQEVYPV